MDTNRGLQITGQHSSASPSPVASDIAVSVPETDEPAKPKRRRRTSKK